MIDEKFHHRETRIFRFAQKKRKCRQQTAESSENKRDERLDGKSVERLPEKKKRIDAEGRLGNELKPQMTRPIDDDQHVICKTKTISSSLDVRY